jgi:hypothetical protein
MKKITQLEPLTSKESKTLEQCEAVIRSGKRAFLKVGEALATINDQRLYRAKHATFADYCKSLGISAKHAYGFINAFNVAQEIAGAIDQNQAQPKSMSHFLALKGLSVDKLKEAMRLGAEQANAAGRAVTEKDFKAARKQVEAAEVKDAQIASKSGKSKPGPAAEQVNLPIVDPSDILLWVVEAEKQLKERQINQAIENLSRIHSAIAAWIKTQEIQQAA